MAFQKAVKYEAKGRIALTGPAGSGKSMTMLKAARALAGPTGRIAAIDTEHGSLSKYADLFDFDVNEISSYSPDAFLANLREAEQANYAVFCCDSLSHFWMGKDGALEWVDAAKRRSSSKDDMAGWKDFKPVERTMIDAMIASPCHIIVTMRTKTEYTVVEKTNSRGEMKKVREKVGLAPVQRDSLEYEFDLVGMMDPDNSLVIEKTRCSFYNEKVFSKPSEEDFRAFVEWLKGEKATELPPCGDCTGRIMATPKHTALSIAEGTAKTYGVSLCYQCAAKRREAKTEGDTATKATTSTGATPANSTPTTQTKPTIGDDDIPGNMGGTHTDDGVPSAANGFAAKMQAFAAIKAELPPRTYYRALEQFGVKHANELKGKAMDECLTALQTTLADWKFQNEQQQHLQEANQ